MFKKYNLHVFAKIETKKINIKDIDEIYNNFHKNNWPL